LSPSPFVTITIVELYTETLENENPAVADYSGKANWRRFAKMRRREFVVL